MTTAKKLALAMVLMILAVIAYAAATVAYMKHTVPGSAQTSSNLHQIISTIVEFKSQRGEWPDSPEQLGLSTQMLLDHVSGAPLQWRSPIRLEFAGGTRYPVVWQPRPFRTQLWPFGEIQQYAVLSDGSVTIHYNRLERLGAP